MRPARRSYVKVDRFALFELGDDYHLTGNERWMLASVVFLASWRTRSWTGSYCELQEATGLAYRTVVAALDCLTRLELLVIAQPFGRSRRGTVQLAAGTYDQLIFREESSSVVARSRADTAPLRAGTARSRDTSLLTRKDDPQGSREAVKGGSGEEAAVDREWEEKTLSDRTLVRRDADRPRDEPDYYRRDREPEDLGDACADPEWDDDPYAVADDSPDLANGPACSECGAPPPRRATFGWHACDHQLKAAQR